MSNKGILSRRELFLSSSHLSEQSSTPGVTDKEEVSVEVNGKWVVGFVLLGSIAMAVALALTIKSHNKLVGSVRDQLVMEINTNILKGSDTVSIEGTDYVLGPVWDLRLEKENVFLTFPEQVSAEATPEKLSKWFQAWFKGRFPKEKKVIAVDIKFEKKP